MPGAAVIAGGHEISWTVEAEYPVALYVLLPGDCAALESPVSLDIDMCESGNITSPTTPGDIDWLFVAPQAFSGPAIGFEYTLELCGIQCDTIPVEDRTWGEVKSLFR